MFSIFIKRSRDALLVLALGLFGLANAEGPVGVAALPGGGGNVVIDTDVTEGGGLGQRWGRAGGRTITYHVANPATFSALVFGVVQGTAPSLAFDAAVNATGEVMTYTAGQSNLAQGMARWTGFATLPLFGGGSVPNLPTRFTITVTRTNGTAVPLAVDPSGPNPMASVLATGDFRVNLLFEMQDLSNASIFRPVLDYYDTLSTPPGQLPATNIGPVMTGVNTGFYYTVADTGMTIEEHDAHLQALFDGITPEINNINDKINFLRTDWDGRIPAIQNQVGDVFNTLNNSITPTLSQIQTQVSQLLGQSGGTGNLATKQDVDNAKNQLSEMLMIVLGVMPCPPQAPPGFCTNFRSLAGLGAEIEELQVALDNMASQSLDVSAVQIDSGNPKQLRWLVKTTRDGVMVNASLTRFATIRTPGAAVLTNVLGNATVATLVPGLHDVTLALVKDVTDGVAYLFEASLTAGGSTIQGSALLVTEKKGASPF